MNGNRYVESGSDACDRESVSTVWGPWQAVMEEAVACCDARIGRLCGAVKGKTDLQLEEFRIAARDLFELGGELVERCEDHERWMRARSKAQGQVDRTEP